jgi:hypothetical protein
VRAHFTDNSVFVYQAFREEIAIPAVDHQRFISPFGRGRMTWIKPSFAWMMYRSGWAQKEGQERVLRVEISRDGFEWALSNSCLSSFEAGFHPTRDSWKALLTASPVRIQWDPERTLLLEPLPWRTIQIGIGPAAVARYIEEWTLGIEDITPLVGEVCSLVRAGDFEQAACMVPEERPYELNREVSSRIMAG